MELVERLWVTEEARRDGHNLTEIVEEQLKVALESAALVRHLAPTGEVTVVWEDTRTDEFKQRWFMELRYKMFMDKPPMEWLVTATMPVEHGPW